MIQKRVRPWILQLNDMKELCCCIDVLNQFMSSNPRGGILDRSADDHSTVDLSIKHLHEFASKKLFQDMQERLLLMSHYKI